MGVNCFLKISEVSLDPRLCASWESEEVLKVGEACLTVKAMGKEGCEAVSGLSSSSSSLPLSGCCGLLYYYLNVLPCSQPKVAIYHGLELPN